MACNPRNTFPGSIFNNAARALDLYGTNIEVDYRGYEVTVENFIRLLTDRLGEEVPRGKRLGSDAGSNVLVYMTGHGGKEFLKFQDAEEIGSWDLADAFEQMWEKKRYREMLFMIDTCQANTMYERFYSPNIIATGSSAVDQSSYSHHADNDVGVAVIDRYTYYNLEFLEERVPDVSSRVTVGELFDSYDEAKIHSQAGVRWDLFEGGEAEGRKRLIMDFFGNVQGVEVEAGPGFGGNESEWREDIRLLEEIWRQGKEMEREMEAERVGGWGEGREGGEGGNGGKGGNKAGKSTDGEVMREKVSTRPSWGAAKVDASSSWLQRLTGAGALLGCALVWGAASWMEKPRG